MPRVQLTATSKPFVSFYDKNDLPSYEFANYYGSQSPPQRSTAMTIGGLTYKTPEHYFQAQKITHPDPNTEKNLRAEFLKAVGDSPDQARTSVDKFIKDANNRNPSAGINGGQSTPTGWHDKGKTDAMANVIRERVKNDPIFAQRLMATGNDPIVEDTGGAPYPDDDWGCGVTGNGKNLLGICLMQVREQINDPTLTDAVARDVAINLYVDVQQDIVNLNRKSPALDPKNARKYVQPPNPPLQLIQDVPGIFSKGAPPTYPGTNLTSTHSGSPIPANATPAMLQAIQLLDETAGGSASFSWKVTPNNSGLSEISNPTVFADLKTDAEKQQHINDLEHMLLAYARGRPADEANNPIVISGNDAMSRQILEELCKRHNLPFKHDIPTPPLQDPAVITMLNAHSAPLMAANQAPIPAPGTPQPAPAGTVASAVPAGTAAPAVPAGTATSAVPASSPAPAVPASSPAPVVPASTPAPAVPASSPAPAVPASIPAAPAVPAGTSAAPLPQPFVLPPAPNANNVASSHETYATLSTGKPDSLYEARPNEPSYQFSANPEVNYVASPALNTQPYLDLPPEKDTDASIQDSNSTYTTIHVNPAPIYDDASSPMKGFEDHNENKYASTADAEADAARSNETPPYAILQKSDSTYVAIPVVGAASSPSENKDASIPARQADNYQALPIQASNSNAGPSGLPPTPPTSSHGPLNRIDSDGYMSLPANAGTPNGPPPPNDNRQYVSLPANAGTPNGPPLPNDNRQYVSLPAGAGTPLSSEEQSVQEHMDSQAGKGTVIEAAHAIAPALSQTPPHVALPPPIATDLNAQPSAPTNDATTLKPGN